MSRGSAPILLESCLVISPALVAFGDGPLGA